MQNNVPFFEVNGKKYEIKRNRYLQAETDKLKSEIALSDEEQVALVKEKDQHEALEKLAKRKDELYEKYLATFSQEDEDMYNKACAAYDNLLDKIGKSSNIIGENAKRYVAIGEKIILKALQFNEKGDNIRSEKEAAEIWDSFKIEYGEVAITNFVIYTFNYIVGASEDQESPFVTQAKAKAEQRANMKRGIAGAR